MICAWCKSDIENDSFYCDQCSKELFICPVCGKPGKGKNCVTDGNPLYSPKQKASGVAQGAAPAGAPQSVSLFGNSPTPPQPPAQQVTPQPTPQPVMQPQPVTPQPSPQPVMQPRPVMPQPSPQTVRHQPSTTANSSMPGLKLINKHLNIEIDIKDGAIIGRATGDHVSVFSQFSQVSGRHLQFKFDSNQGWTVTDLGSTNGVAISNQANWQQVPKLSPNMATAIKDNAFILIANIEFQVKMIQSSSSNFGTSRI